MSINQIVKQNLVKKFSGVEEIFSETEKQGIQLIENIILGEESVIKFKNRSKYLFDHITIALDLFLAKSSKMAKMILVNFCPAQTANDYVL